jgi:hypothetical protein
MTKQARSHTDTFNRARLGIDDEMVELHAATGILHLAYHDMSEGGNGDCALALSVFSAARTIEALMERIDKKLATAAPICSCHDGGACQ